MKTIVIGEIGINHNADLNIAKKLIDISAFAGCKYVKLQKRNPDVCVPEDQKNKIRQTPWGEMTYLEYKYKMEFDMKQYNELVSYANSKEISLFSSVWDKDSVDFLTNFTTKTTDFNIPTYKNTIGIVMKIPSALITNLDLIKYARKKSDVLLMSTGMSTEKQIIEAVKTGDPDIIFHTNSTYPCPVDELNLSYITWLKEKYPNKIIGYSGHEYGLITTYAALMLGATVIERHITLDKSMWGSDQHSSLSPDGLIKLCKGIKDIESSLGGYGPREILGGELNKLKSLRK